MTNSPWYNQYFCVFTVFSITFPCTGNISADVEVVIQMNISIFSASNISVLNFKRKKTCLMGELDKAIHNRVTKKHNFEIHVPVNDFLKNIYHAYFLSHGWIKWNTAHRAFVCPHFILAISALFHSGHILKWHYKLKTVNDFPLISTANWNQLRQNIRHLLLGNFVYNKTSYFEITECVNVLWIYYVVDWQTVDTRRHWGTSCTTTRFRPSPHTPPTRWKPSTASSTPSTWPRTTSQWTVSRLRGDSLG